MKWTKQIFIAIGILGVVCLSGFIVYNIAYGIGEAEGHDKGYSSGQKIGYSSGQQEGYDEGYATGKQDGYGEGYDLGEADGYEDGYAEGVEAGLGHGYTLRDPTYKEAVTFLRKDRTDRNKYVEDSYVCSHFARDACNNAEEEGLRCAFVELRFGEGGHSIIAFDTIDEELVYFEPQFDDEVKVIINQSYSRLNNYQKPPGSDTIIDVLVIW